jgi:tetratricopeptide (TPR) repeat protein
VSRKSGHSPQVTLNPPNPWPDSPVCLTVAIFTVTLLAYLPALSGSMLWDDAGHITRPDLRSLAGLARIWFEFGATQQYYPVLHSAFWLEHWLWGDATIGYHLLNVGLHATAACLFGTLLRRLAVPGAAFAALLFALHPVSVESVAWISEQKNTLSLVFYLCAALAWLRFDAGRSPRNYALASTLFLLALLTKTVTATLPATLLVVCWWRRGRLDVRRDVVPLLPWFVFGAVSGLVTAHFERVLIGAQGTDFNLSVVQRGLLAGRVFWFYLGKLAWPADLTFIYPHWTVDPDRVGQWLFPVATLLLPILLLWRRRRGPLAAILLFGGALFPVLGFFNVFPFLYSYVADHFQYLASLPIYALAAAGLVAPSTSLPRWSRLTASAVLLALLGTLTWRHAGIFHDPEILYRSTLANNSSCWMAHNNLAIVLAASNRTDEAIPHLKKAIALRPDYPEAENNLGDDLTRLGRAEEAIPHLVRAIELQPGYAIAECNLGLALATTGRTAEAITHFATAVRLNPTYADAELNWGIGLMLSGRFPEAVPHFEKAVSLEPDSIEIRDTYGRALMQAGRFEESLDHFRHVLELDPGRADTHMNLALALRQLGRKQEAAGEYLEAVRLDPSLAKRH